MSDLLQRLPLLRASVEALNITILYGLLGRIKSSSMPFIQYFAGKLGAIIDGNGLGKTDPCSGFAPPMEVSARSSGQVRVY